MPLFRRLWGKAKKQDGGTQIEKVVKYALSTQGGFYSGLDTLDTAQEQTRTRAYWTWRQIHQPIVLSNIDIAKNGGSEKLFDMVREDTKDAGDALRDKLGDALYTAQTGDAIDSLVDATDDGTLSNTYGGINQDNYSWWQAQYNATGGVLTLSMLATEYDLCASGNDKPTLLVTDEATWSLYEALLQPQVRYNFNAGGGYPTIDGGFSSLLYRGTPMIADEDCTAGYIYFLNEKYLNLVYLKHPKFPTDSKGFSVSDFREPTDQDGSVGYIFSYLDLICIQPRRQGVIRSVT